MTTDVRDLLREGAASPSAELDADGVVRVASARRRRSVVVTALGVVVVAVASLGLVRAADDGGSSARVAVGPRQSSEVPAGWTPIEVDPGIRLAIPPGWGPFRTETVPPPIVRVSMGTSVPTDASIVSACAAELGQIPTHPGAWITLWEYPGVTGSEVPVAGGTLGVVDRPVAFSTAFTGTGPVCPYAGDAASGDVGAAAEMLAFRDAGRVFAVRVVSAYPAGATPNFDDANQILDTLRIAPLASTTTEPVTTTTTAVPFVPASADEQEISRVFVEWQRVHTDDEVRALVEDADALLDSIHQGMAQHSEADLTGYSGRVESVTMTDVDHATVQYVLLWNGQSQFGVRTGTAVRVDGVWKVSRDTECALLSLGGISCPPRSAA
jgi:hypothetical protein